MKCSMCQAENPVGQSYCGRCGARLIEGERSDQEPYYTFSMWGTTTTFTRWAYWVYYGMITGICFLASSVWLALNWQTAAEPVLFGSLVFFVLALFAYAVAYARIRNYQSRKK